MMRRLLPRLLLLAAATMLGAMVPVPRGIPMKASASGAASCCCASETSSAMSCVSVASCSGCPTAPDEASGVAKQPGTLKCDPSMSCVCCLCGIGLVAIAPSIPGPGVSDLSRSLFEPDWSSIELPPAQPPPEGTFSHS